MTSTAAELNALDGITSTVTELNYTDGVTSAIQTQMDAKAALASPTFTGVPAAPTATTGTDTTQVATTAYVVDEIPNQLNATGLAPLYGCRAWVNFDGSGTIRGSGNVASVTRNGTGDFSITFTTAMPDANYSSFAMVSDSATGSAVTQIDAGNVPTASVLRIRCKNAATNGTINPSFVMVSVFR